METYNTEIYTRIVKAGRRTYFIDVRATKNTSELYITITEKKRNENDSEKFKIFLYREDFDKFMTALTDS
ncbi:MAG: PUR family DNA/RNA-binding protein, partial [Ignavibacteria bacterium]|nr:PUR family DNA/RNA-binding protein [Ignavibacteria bacterium]